MKRFVLLALAAGHILLVHAQSWSLTGNAGTNPNTDFVGTTDTVAFHIRVNNQLSGIIDFSANASTGFGYQSLFFNAGTANTGLGYLGAAHLTSGSYNTAVGYNALVNGKIENKNTSVGAYTMMGDSSGSSNSAFGYDALVNDYSGNGNSAFGDFAMATNRSGSNNTCVGDSADVQFDGFSNSTALGHTATITASNQVRIGNSSVTSIGGFVAWSNVSDGRFKKNVTANVPGLTFIDQLKPVTYNLDAPGIDAFLHSGGKGGGPSNEDQTALRAKEQTIYSGFIAQDVEAAAKKIGYQFSGVDAPKGNSDLYGLRYSDFVVPLVKAVQELSSQNSNLQSQVDSLQSQITSILQQLAALKASPITSISGGSSPYLQQNAPNPFNSSTLINYYIPSMNNNAQMVITSSAGQVVKSVILSNSGSGQVTINAGELAAGTYFYTLYIDGKLAGTKQMVLTK
jgi:hypothetical protein